MESRPQNPEFWINPENFHPCKLYLSHRLTHEILFCLFELMLYIHVNNFSDMLEHFLS